ncbi:MAG TPA: serine/threonine-protein kinase [Kofleriaceae bacterium]|nr:serine/threonine-protein kinase [Kofleriaceae bacterium]
MGANDRIGGYQVIKPLGQGGMADVYLATYRGPAGFERRVALKVLDQERSQDAEACALFTDEARLAGMLHHKNIAQVLEVAREAGRHYLAMEYIDGVDLCGLLDACARRNVMPSYEVALAIVAQVAEGLDHAHRRCDANGRPLQLVHRDVSLSNIMVSHAGNVKVLDFGIAQSTLSSVPNVPGIVRGKAGYMSPEQCVGDPVDRRTDVFALGIVLYELTTGARCFVGNSDFDTMIAIARGTYTRPCELVADYPVALERVVMKALAPTVEQRYQSCAELIDAIEGVMRGYGWLGGSAAIERAMRELFSDESAAPELEAATVREPAPPPMTASLDVPRLARGSVAHLPWYVDEEEAMTRGRRPLSRWAAPQIAA